MTDRFDSETVRRYLTSSGVSVTVFDEVDSTNRIALELAEGGAPEGTAIVAASQTAEAFTARREAGYTSASYSARRRFPKKPFYSPLPPVSPYAVPSKA